MLAAGLETEDKSPDHSHANVRSRRQSVIDTSLIFEFRVPSEKLVAQVFGLSPAEARLAQRMARGNALEDIAADGRYQDVDGTLPARLGVRQDRDESATQTGRTALPPCVRSRQQESPLGASSGQAAPSPRSVGPYCVQSDDLSARRPT